MVEANLGASGAGPAGDSAALTPELDAIERAFTDLDQKTSRRANRLRWWGIAAVLAGPLAVIPLAIQIAAFPEGGPVGTGLILFELIVLFSLLYLTFAQVGPSQESWMRDRIRVELLRRERFLVLARVGPYLTSRDPRALLGQRFAYIIDPVTEPERLIFPEDASGTPWSHTLEQAGPGGTATPESHSLDEYLAERIGRQQHWYLERGEDHERTFKWIEATDRFALTLALVVSAFHLAGLFLAHPEPSPAAASHGEDGPTASVASADTTHGANRPWQSVVLEATALLLPAIGASAAGLQTFLESRRLARTYRSQSQRLQRIGLALEALRPELPAASAEHQLKRLVLHAEGLLAEELHQWWLHAYR